MSHQMLLVFSNFPDRANAEAAARTLINQGVAACVNVLAECASVYRWQGKIECASEVPLLIKTTRSTYPALEVALRELHPYELPEIIAVPVTAGLPAYLAWVAEETQSRNPKE